MRCVRRGSAWRGAWPAAALAACAVDAPSAPVVAPLYEVPGCGGPDAARMAPFRGDLGEHACAAVGAGADVAAGAFPERPGDVLPVVFVLPGAAPGGDGSRASPYGDLAAALGRSPMAATILIGRGVLSGAAAAVAVERDLTLRGAGAGATVLAGGASGLVVAARGVGARFTLTVEEVTLRASGGVVAEVRGAAATLALREVRVEGGTVGVSAAEGATLCAARTTLRGGAARGVSLTAGATGFLREVLVRDGGGVGVWSERAHLAIERSLVAANARDGVVMRGVSTGSPCETDADCPAEPACGGPGLTRRCVAARDAGASRRCRGVTRLSELVALGNGVTGLRAERSYPTADEAADGSAPTVFASPGPIVLASRLVVAGTRLPDGAVGGDGFYIGATAEVSLDEGIASDAGRGRGSEFVGNARAGLLLDGERLDDPPSRRVPAALARPGRALLAGALVASNRGPGVFVQARAEVPRFGWSEVSDNGGAGLGVTGAGRVASIQCNRFVFTRAAHLQFTDPALAPVDVGDGVSLADDVGGAVEVVDTELGHNARFGLVSSGVDLRLRGATRGRGNAFGVGLRAATVLEGAAAAIEGRAPPPAAFAVARGPLASVGP